MSFNVKAQQKARAFRKEHGNKSALEVMREQAMGKALKKKAGGMYGDAAMKRFTTNKERKHKEWDKKGI